MNNSKLIVDSVKLSLDEPVDNTVHFRERESQLVRIISALQGVQKSKDWSTLKTESFDGLTESLEGRLFSEAKKESPDTNKLNRLAGELKWAERFSDLGKLEQEFKLELANIKQKLYGTT
jgi:hypothetical protein